MGAAAPPTDVDTTGSSPEIDAQAATTAPDWRQNPYVQIEGGFLAGVSLGLVPMGGVGQQLADAGEMLPHGTPEARLGLAVGMIVGGIATTAGGVAGGLLGVATTATGAGAPVGVPAMVLSTTLVVGGAGNIAAGIRGLTQSMMSSGSGSSSPQATAPSAGGRPAGQRVNMPSWRKVTIDMEEVASGHMQGGWRLSAGNRKDIFPSNMTQAQVEKAIRNAYRHGEALKSQGINGERVFVSGPFGSGRIEMWVNKETK